MASYDIEHSVPASSSNTIPPITTSTRPSASASASNSNNSSHRRRRSTNPRRQSTSTSTSTSAAPATASSAPRRPDFSSFFSHLTHTDTSSATNPNVTAMPSDISAAYRLLAEGFERMRQDNHGHGQYGAGDNPLDDMIAMLAQGIQRPPEKVSGVGQEFLDGLERVDKKILKKDMDCPICGNAFLDDPYPLVIRLPCNRKHLFDLECVAPWLKLNATCPLDRKELVKKKPTKEEEKKAKESSGDAEEEDGEYDDMYA